jgi:cyclopropane-fatty-acyl-phospholipid synthase
MRLPALKKARLYFFGQRRLAAGLAFWSRNHSAPVEVPGSRESGSDARDGSRQVLARLSLFFPTVLGFASNAQPKFLYLAKDHLLAGASVQSQLTRLLVCDTCVGPMPTQMTTQRAKITLIPKAVENHVKHILRIFKDRFAVCPIPFVVETPDHETIPFGEGAPEFQIQIANQRGLLALGSADEGRIADAFLEGHLKIEGNFLRVMELRSKLSDKHPLNTLWRFTQPLLYGQVGTNARAIHNHYDLEPDFYLSFMDPKTQCYTQGIFLDENESLEVATQRKLDFCFKECGLKAGDSVLEVGPGWGAFSRYAAERGVHITAVTNSQKSREFMQALGKKLHIEWNIVLEDILNFDRSERFDAIVLMGIMEHLPDYTRVLKKFLKLLKPGGHIYLDASATRVKFDAPSFISRYIYQGNHSFFILHDFLAAAAKTPFYVRCIYNDRHSYFLTFRYWARNFEANRDKVIRRFGEYHFRRFQLYLWGSAHSFLSDGLQCYRVVLEMPVGR